MTEEKKPLSLDLTAQENQELNNWLGLLSQKAMEHQAIDHYILQIKLALAKKYGVDPNEYTIQNGKLVYVPVEQRPNNNNGQTEKTSEKPKIITKK